jgi:hypothetical protein
MVPVFVGQQDGTPKLINGFVPETAWLSDAGIVGNTASNVCEMLYFRPNSLSVNILVTTSEDAQIGRTGP